MSRRLTDDEILNAVFHGGGEISLPGTFGDQTAEAAAAAAASKISDSMLMQLKQLEQDAVGLANEGDLDGAYTVLSKAVDQCPTYASAYNNRAQVLRLQEKDDAALDDLCKAIEYATPTRSQTTLKQAYTQRAIIKKKRGDVAGSEQDFAKGAQFGNEVAKGMVKSNPYAKL
ncbi:hypothetical protein BDEG_24310 [Batrachochytrium dendrobatidis JEL423]|nr:hypothetical protein BDEG_24310 [Batrachochytrium dendrobatidis JEL423]